MRKIEIDAHPNFEAEALTRMEDAIDAAWERTFDVIPCLACAKAFMLRQIEMRARRAAAQRRRRNAIAIAEAAALAPMPPRLRASPEDITDDDIPF